MKLLRIQELEEKLFYSVSHLKNVMSLPCLRRTGFVGSLGESDWSEFLLEGKCINYK